MNTLLQVASNIAVLAAAGAAGVPIAYVGRELAGRFEQLALGPNAPEPERKRQGLPVPKI